MTPKIGDGLAYWIIKTMWRVFGPVMGINDAVIRYGKMTTKRLDWWTMMMDTDIKRVLTKPEKPRARDQKR